MSLRTESRDYWEGESILNRHDPWYPVLQRMNALHMERSLECKQFLTGPMYFHTRLWKYAMVIVTIDPSLSFNSWYKDFQSSGSMKQFGCIFIIVTVLSSDSIQTQIRSQVVIKWSPCNEPWCPSICWPASETSLWSQQHGVVIKTKQQLRVMRVSGPMKSIASARGQNDAYQTDHDKENNYFVNMLPATGYREKGWGRSRAFTFPPGLCETSSGHTTINCCFRFGFSNSLVSTFLCSLKTLAEEDDSI